MMNNEEILKLLKQINNGKDFSGDNLLTDRILDSMELISLVSKIESLYNIKINFEDITPQNFDSVEKIVILLRKKKCTIQ